MPHLRPCSGCNRHVRSDEVRCPFCDGALALDERPPPVPAGRIGRAALMAFGAAIATASLAGCKGEEPAIGAEESAPTARPDTETRSAPAEDDRRRPGSAEKAEKADTAPIRSPFLVGAEPPPLPPSNIDARPQETAGPVVVPPVNTIKRPPPDNTWNNKKRVNNAMPYGAPPADGLPEIV